MKTTTNTNFNVFAIFALATFASFSLMSCGDKHSHDEASSPIYKIPATKFKADNDLQERMKKLNQIMINLHDEGADLSKGGADMEAVVNDIFKTCKLEPEPDKALHPILGNILEATKLLKNKKDAEAMEIIHRALAAYNDSFDPGIWEE
ncbi:MAG: hypothetical protein H3C43_08915 [Leptonema sp. (in: Bacteria)]|nr:hypothetical protein [Leptonema sp. (in: bacteria)]